MSGTFLNKRKYQQVVHPWTRIIIWKKKDVKSLVIMCSKWKEIKQNLTLRIRVLYYILDIQNTFLIVDIVIKEKVFRTSKL